MKKLLLCVIFGLLLLTASCSSDGSLNESSHTGYPDISEALTENEADNGSVGLDLLDISGVIFTNLQNQYTVEHSATNFVNEFKSFVSNQLYTAAEMTYSDSCTATLLDNEKKAILELTISERSITFDRNVKIKGRVYEKGTVYETSEWINEYMDHFIQGMVLNPAHISYPAKFRMPDEYYRVDMQNAGDYTINKYETMTGLYAFTDKSLMGRSFEIVGLERLYSDDAIKVEEEKMKKTRAIHINCDSSDPYICISSQNEYKEYARGYQLSIYKDPERPALYRLVTNGEVFLVQVDGDFDKAFQKLFDNDAKSGFKLGASDVIDLFAQKKPYFVEYLCRNLGMEMWNRRGDDDKLVQSTVKLDNENPYTVLNIVNAFNSRLMIFSYSTGKYIDYIDFGGRQAGTEYKIQQAGGNAWIVGDRCIGYGTGESIYYREWYSVDHTGKKLCLSIPYNTYQVGPYGGSILQAREIRLADSDPVRLTVSYSITGIYMLDIAEADEQGQVKVTAEKEVEFVWDPVQRIFISKAPVDADGLTQIGYTDTEIPRLCGAILDREYDNLLAGIKALDSEENLWNRTNRVDSYKAFLDDCPESTKKESLLMLLKQD